MPAWLLLVGCPFPGLPLDTDPDGDTDTDPDTDTDTDPDTDTDDLDPDGDGVEAPADCEPFNEGVFPGNSEICNNEVDEDCDAGTEDGTATGCQVPPDVVASDVTIGMLPVLHSAAIGLVGGMRALGFGSDLQDGAYGAFVESSSVHTGSLPHTPSATFVTGGDLDGDCDADLVAFDIGGVAGELHVVTELASGSPVTRAFGVPAAAGIVVDAVVLPNAFDPGGGKCATSELVLLVLHMDASATIWVFDGGSLAVAAPDLSAVPKRTVTSLDDRIDHLEVWVGSEGPRIVAGTNSDKLHLIDPAVTNVDLQTGSAFEQSFQVPTELNEIRVLGGDWDGDGVIDLILGVGAYELGDARVLGYDGLDLDAGDLDPGVEADWVLQGDHDVGAVMSFGPDRDLDMRPDLYLAQRTGPDEGVIFVVGSRRNQEDMILLTTDSYDRRIVGGPNWLVFGNTLFAYGGDLAASGRLMGQPTTVLLHGF